jgi:hypothetical protein
MFGRERVSPQASNLCSSAVRPVHCAGSELVVLVFEQDVERGERAVTARDVLLQLELVRFCVGLQFHSPQRTVKHVMQA